MQRYCIDYAQMNTVRDGKTAPADLAWTAKDVHEFYDVMRAGGRVTTTQVPVEEFNRVFRKHLDEGRDIVYIGCSSRQSGSVNAARVLAEKLKEEYSGAEISCIDSLHACMGEGILAMEAAKLAEAGKSVEEITDAVLEKSKYLHQFCTVHSLDTFRRAGRVKASAAFFGNLMGVKPIIVTDADGEQAAYKKVKGRGNSLKEIVSLLKEHITDAENQTVYLVHADCAGAEVETVKNMIKNEIPCRDIYTGYIGPIIGASIGPDAIAVYGFGKEITFRSGDK